jgi:hypothetical protein
MDAGAVSTAHLESVQRGERLMDRQSQCDRRRIRAPTHKTEYSIDRAEAIASDRPNRVLEIDERCVELFELVPPDGAVGVKCSFESGNLEIQTGDEIGDLRGEAHDLDERPHSGNTAQEQVAALHVSGRFGHR